MAKVRADSLLVARGLADSRAKARAAIEAGGVLADGSMVAKASELLDETVALTAEAAHPWVGRGALKLVAALDLWPVTVEGRTVLDIGASTGGFTEVCLARGAVRVFAVDVGRGQLHPKLRYDGRVVSLESTDARALTTDLVPQPPDLVVCDASFIGLAKVLPAALSLARDDADLIALVKPQFEVGPDRVGKGGLVTDLGHQAEALVAVVTFLEANSWLVQARAESPIAGGAGQREFLVWAQKNTR